MIAKVEIRVGKDVSPHFAGSSIESGEARPLHTLRAVAAPRFLECLATVAAEHRERVGAELIDISYWSRASQGKVSKFENHVTQTPRDLDYLLMAYAKVADVTPGDLLREAVTRWEAGIADLTNETERPSPRVAGKRQAIQASQRAAQRQREHRQAGTEGPPAPQKKAEGR